MTLPANDEVVLGNVRGSSIEIEAEIDTRGAPVVEMNVLRSTRAEETTRIMFFRERGYRRIGAPWGGTRMSVVTIDSSRSSELPDVTPRAPESAQVFIAREEPLRMRVFVDRSVVEVFVNGRQCAAVRVYPGREESAGVSLMSRGRDAELKHLDAWRMKSVYE